jgi:Transposase, Mutator family
MIIFKKTSQGHRYHNSDADKINNLMATSARMTARNLMIMVPLILDERKAPPCAHPPEIRKAIYTTNAIESLNMSLWKVTKNRGSFPNDEAMMKLLFLAMKNISKKWTMPIREWKSALNQFTILFEGRMPVL